MKLIFCKKCHDMTRLTSQVRTCGCGLSAGKYVDDINAVICGPCVPIGIGNNSLAECLNATGREGTRWEGESREFAAWVIQEPCPTVERVKNLVKM